MSAPAGHCRICSGPLELRFRGTPGGPSAESFSPTYHGTGQHGDLYVCRECATVQQPSLPGGDALHELYRDMSDSDYLVEEEGRRATAGRLLDQVGGYVAYGSLLDVGCGHGVLLDEARKRGYETTGLELSADAARHARETLGLDVQEVPLESFDPGERRFDVIMLADLIEHLEDPVRALDRCYELLADGGVLCVVTPDPSSRTAQIAGSKWWGYIPAHMCLLPRKTLRELLAARGLVISEDGPLVRTFTARLLAERDGGARRADRIGGQAAGRRARGPALDHREPRRRARDPGAQGQAARARPEARARPRRAHQGPHRAAGLQGVGHDPDGREGDPGGRGRPRAAGGRRQPRRHHGRGAPGGLRGDPPPGQPRLRRQPDDVLHPGHPRRRRHRGDGARRQPVRPHARRARWCARSSAARPTW